MRIIPAIDIIAGKCVRLTQGDYSRKKVYNENPLEVAKTFEDNGILYLHLVDLDGAQNKRIINWKILEKIAAKTQLSIDFGGGMNSGKDLQIAFECGAKQINIGSKAVKEPQCFLQWLKKYGSDKIILSADSKNRKIAAHAWQEESKLDVVDFISGYMKKGVTNVVCTDISKDGTLEGPAIKLYEDIINTAADLATKKKLTSIHLIASGGVATLEDLEKLETMGLFGAIVGKAIYEGTLTIKELSNF